MSIDNEKNGRLITILKLNNRKFLIVCVRVFFGRTWSRVGRPASTLLSNRNAMAGSENGRNLSVDQTAA